MIIKGNHPTILEIDEGISLKDLVTELKSLDIRAEEREPNEGIVLKVKTIEAKVQREDLVDVLLGLEIASTLAVKAPTKEAAAPKNEPAEKPAKA